MIGINGRPRFSMIMLLCGLAACVSRPSVEPPAADPPDFAGYRAGGNEPFWNLTFGETTIEFARLGRDDTVRVAQPEPERRDGGWHFEATADERPFVVRIEERQCNDSMNGRPFPHTVEVTVGGESYTGCGGDTASLLTGVTWRVTHLEGDPTTASSRPTLEFESDGMLIGDGGCNRYRATYEITGEGIEIGTLVATRMACADPEENAQETRFFALLDEVTRFDITADGRLQLIAGDRPVVAASN